MKIDKKFWTGAVMTFAIALIAVLAYDGMRMYMANRNGATSNFGGALRFGNRRRMPQGRAVGFQRKRQVRLSGGGGTNPCVNYSPCSHGMVRCAAAGCSCRAISDCRHSEKLDKTEQQVD